MEPISAIVSGVAEIVSVIGENINLGDKAYFENLKKQGPPMVKDWFAKFRTDYTGQMMYLIFGIFGIIAIGIIAIVVSKKKND
jgi:hypothetical protein